MATRTYQAELRWTGSTSLGWDAYDRTHVAVAPPAEQGEKRIGKLVPTAHEHCFIANSLNSAVRVEAHQ